MVIALSLNLKDDILNAVYGCKTPKFRKPTAPPQYNPPPMPPVQPPKPPTSGSNAFKPNPNYVPPASVKPIKKSCQYETPCGWCTRWDKKCDRKSGYVDSPSLKLSETEAQKIINYIKSGKLPPLNTNNTHGLETIE